MKNTSYRFILTLLIVLALATGSYWGMDRLRHQFVPAHPALKDDQLDYFIEDFNLVKITPTKLSMLTPNQPLKYLLVGRKLTHIPADNRAEIMQPFFKELSADGETHARAERALLRQNPTSLSLYQNVLIEKFTLDVSNATLLKTAQLTTDYLQALPDQHLLATDYPVQIQQGASLLTGTGMTLNNITGDFVLQHAVKATYQTQPRL